MLQKYVTDRQTTLFKTT